MNVLLINPEMENAMYTHFTDVARVSGKHALYQPLGLITVASLLPEDWNLRLIDENFSQSAEFEFSWADMVFITGMLGQEQSCQRIISRCNRAGVRVVAGGSLFCFDRERFEGVDHFILNEAELTLPLFLKDLQERSPRVVYETKAYADLQVSPVPKWDLLDMEKYAAMSIQFSRGCPYQCEFCSVPGVVGRKYRHKSVKQVVAELDSLYSMGWRGLIIFCDDNFTGNKSYIKNDLLPALFDWRQDKVGTPFATSVSIDVADDPKLLDGIVRAGFESVFVGIETPSKDSLKEAGKVQNLRCDLMVSVKRLQHAGLEVAAGFIVGFDHDTPEAFKLINAFIQDSGIPYAAISPLNARQGARLFGRLKKEGRLLEHHLSFSRVKHGEVNIVPKMGADALRKGYVEILQNIYSADNYCNRVKSLVREIGSPSVKINPFLYGFSTIIRSIILILLIDRDRIYYGKLLIWTIWRHPKMLAKVLKLAVLGVSLKKSAEQLTLD